MNISVAPESSSIYQAGGWITPLAQQHRELLQGFLRPHHNTQRCPTLATDPLHFQLPPTKNLRPDIREALEAKPRAAEGALAPAAESAAENMAKLG